MRLLLFGGNRQQRVLAPAASASTRRHAPEREFHRRQVPSEEADAMKSLAADQSKSKGEGRGEGERERECIKHVCRDMILMLTNNSTLDF